jgi:hypothetical protein
MKKSFEKISDADKTELKEASPSYRSALPEFDMSLLLDSLAKTPWERMQANDDALNFAESLRTAMERRRAKPQ